MVSGLSKKIYITNLDNLSNEQWKKINNVVLIDDFSGTGKTIITFLQGQNTFFCEKKIFILLVEVMKEAKEKIELFAKENDMNITILTNSIKDKAFFDKSNSFIKKFINISKRRKIGKDFIKGYKESESLVSFFNNTPNNTLGLFWYKSDSNQPLFHRDNDEMPEWKKMKNEKSKRNKEKYYSKEKW